MKRTLSLITFVTLFSLGSISGAFAQMGALDPNNPFSEYNSPLAGR
jgi:hypothetical protein